jgi:hypothetical protein
MTVKTVWSYKLDNNVITDLRVAQTEGDKIQKDRELELDRGLYHQL